MLNALIRKNVAFAKENLAAAKLALGDALAMESMIAKAPLPIGPYDMDDLRKIITKGRLIPGVFVPSARVGTFSRPWRRLVNDLRTNPNDPRHQAANAALKALKIDWHDKGANNLRVFCLLA